MSVSDFLARFRKDAWYIFLRKLLFSHFLLTLLSGTPGSAVFIFIEVAHYSMTGERVVTVAARVGAVRLREESESESPGVVVTSPESESTMPPRLQLRNAY